ncbi:MAG: hypothetical protein QOC63_6154 [Mycobacterium sp.]|nr:hypothetical protein [Mycobacterium sp.]
MSDLIREYDELWSSLDFVGLADLWERGGPQPIYVGDEYAVPLVGNDDLDRHWARVASRVKAASVSSELHAFDVLDEAVVRVVLLSRWRLTGRESDIGHTGEQTGEHTGASWVTWLLIRRGERYRIFHHMESQVYLPEDEGQ